MKGLTSKCKLHTNLSSGNLIDICGQIRRTDMTTLIGLLHEAPKKWVPL